MYTLVRRLQSANRDLIAHTILVEYQAEHLSGKGYVIDPERLEDLITADIRLEMTEERIAHTIFEWARERWPETSAVVIESPRAMVEYRPEPTLPAIEVRLSIIEGHLVARSSNPTAVLIDELEKDEGLMRRLGVKLSGREGQS